MYDIIGDVSKRFKQLNINDDENHTDVVVRNLAIGISAGEKDLSKYGKWFKFNDRVLRNKLNVKTQIQDLFKEDLIS